MRVTVEVTRRPEIADPEGATINRALRDLGHDRVTSVRVDRVIHLEMTGDDETEIREEVAAMCQRMLINPVLEDYEIVVVP